MPDSRGPNSSRGPDSSRGGAEAAVQGEEHWPTLILRGEHDGIASLDDLLAFFARLPGGDKRFAVLPGLAHCTPLGLARHLMWRTVEDFFRAGETGA